jgi:hypothetical protein
MSMKTEIIVVFLGAEPHASLASDWLGWERFSDTR